MKFCSKCGKELFDEAVVCTNCGCAVDSNNTPAAVVDEVSVGFCVLSFFVPLFGVIYWAIKYKETPKRAKACGITAIVAWALNIVFSIVWGAIIGSLLGSMMYF